MKTIKSIFITLSFVLFLSCASNVSIKDYSDNGLKNYKTFSYQSSKEDKSLTSLINLKMIEKGFKYDNGSPDMLISISTSTEVNEYLKKKRNEGGGSSTGPNFASTSSGTSKRYTSSSDDDYDSSRRPLKTGSVAVQIFDKKSNQLLWVGMVKEFKSLIGDDTFREKIILEIFKDFPSRN